MKTATDTTRSLKAKGAAVALCAAMACGCLAGCGGDTESPSGGRADMPAADAELLEYINMYYDEYQNADSLDGIPFEVLMSASEEMEAMKEHIAEGAKETDAGDGGVSTDEGGQAAPEQQG